MEEEAIDEEEEEDKYYHDDLNAGTGSDGKKQKRLMWQHKDDVDEAEDDDDDRANQASTGGKGDDSKSDEKCPKISIRPRSNSKHEAGDPYQHQEQHPQNDEESQHEQQQEEISRRRKRPSRSIVIPSLANDSLKFNDEETFDNLRTPSYHQRQEEEELSITDESTRIVPDRGKTKVVIHQTEEAQRANIEAEENADDCTSEDFILMDKCSKYVSKVKTELLALDREEHFERFLQVLGYWEEDELSCGEVLYEMRLVMHETSDETLLDEFISFLPSDAHEAARLEIAAARLVKEEKIFQKERAN